MSTSQEPTIRSARLDGAQWAATLAQVRSRAGYGSATTTTGAAPPAGTHPSGAEAPPSPADLLARHGSAPVRASLVATAGRRGSVARASLVGDEALVILQAIAEGDGRILIEPGAELRLATPQTLWSALQAALPQVEALRAPANAVGHDQEAPPEPDAPDRHAAVDPGLADGARWPGTTLDDADAILQVVVEAWPTPDRPASAWARLWAVADDTLFDVQRHDGALTRTPRPAGSVAAELQWALVGAIGIAGGRRNRTPDIRP